MSLNYDLTECDQSKIYDESGEWMPFVTRIIFSCMSVGIGEITSKNVKEFYARDVLFDRIHGFDELPYESYVAMIGLKTNVFPNESRASWMKRIVGRQLDVIRHNVTAEAS